MTTVVEQSPSDWLLEQFDNAVSHTYQRRPQGTSVMHARPMFQVIDDHPGDECRITAADLCPMMSGYARWPDPIANHDLH